MIAIDTETALASNAEPIPRLVSVAIYPGALVPAHDPAAKRFAEAAYTAGPILANAPFDAFVIGRQWPDLWPLIVDAYAHDRVADVLTREKMIDIAEGTSQGRRYNLGSVADRRAAITLDKDDPWRLRYIELLGLPLADWPEAARAYAIKDPWATYRVWEEQEKVRGEHAIDVFKDASNTARAHLALHQQTLIGIATDPEAVDALDRRLGEELDAIAGQLMFHGLARVGGTKKAPKVTRNQKVARALMLQISGQESLSQGAMEAARIPEDHPLDLYRRFGATQALRSGRVPILRRPLIRTRYDVLKVTGRTGSSAPQYPRKPHEVAQWEWIGTNLQNQPQRGGFRECLVPRDPGSRFVISDWGGAELVTLAQVQLDLFGRSRLAEVLAEGRNPHTEFACSGLLGIPVDQYDKTNPEHHRARQLAKIFNFGKPGGMGVARFAAFLAKQGVYKTESEVRKLSKLWLNQWPEMRAYFDYIHHQQGADGLATIVQPRSGLICAARTFTESCNLLFQGLAASAAKLALWDLWLAGRDPASPLYGCPQVLFVHDENVTECPADRAEAVRVEQERIMVAAFRVWCPDVPIAVESKIAERYCK